MSAAYRVIGILLRGSGPGVVAGPHPGDDRAVAGRTPPSVLLFH
jgi:hypothetical protein